MLLKNAIRYSVLILILLGVGFALIRVIQKDVKPSHKEANLTVLPFSHEDLQHLSREDVRKRLEEVHSRIGINPEITPERLERFLATRDENSLKKEWDALMDIPGRHSSKEWFTALENFHRKGRAGHLEQAAQSKRDIENTKAEIEKTKRIMAETAEKVAESRRRTAEAIARYEARLAGNAASQNGSESDNTPTFSEPLEGTFISPPEVSESIHSTALQESESLQESASETFDPNAFINALTKWQKDINKSYADVLLVEGLTSEAFDKFFSTEASRAQFRVQQQQMYADIARRVQGLLAEDTGNREEKLSIIRQTLSENWSPDIADGVLERLK